MSSFRNAINRKPHRERSQPASRAKLGLLEHHKDYKLRAKDYHRKNDTIQQLREKAALRNPDEYYTRMHREQTVNGQHVAKRAGADERANRSFASLQKMKQQDAVYLTMQQQQENKVLEKFKQSMPLLAVKQSATFQSHASDDDEDDYKDNNQQNDKKNKHVVFCDSNDQAQTIIQNADATSSKSSKRKRSKKSQSMILNKSLQTATPGQVQSNERRIEKQQRATLSQLKERQQRKVAIDELASRVQKQRLLMTKGKRMKREFKDAFGDVDESKTIFKWKQQRKK
jgi:U3 small nucleolar RNA-associated protein 11